MANGFMIESRISATNDSALNRDAIAQIAVAGGELVALTSPANRGIMFMLLLPRLLKHLENAGWLIIRHYVLLW